MSSALLCHEASRYINFYFLLLLVFLISRYHSRDICSDTIEVLGPRFILIYTIESEEACFIKRKRPFFYHVLFDSFIFQLAFQRSYEFYILITIPIAILILQCVLIAYLRKRYHTANKCRAKRIDVMQNEIAENCSLDQIPRKIRIRSLHYSLIFIINALYY